MFDFSTTIYLWLEQCIKPKVKSSTLDAYKRRLEKYIIPFFKTKQITNICVKDINEFSNYLLTQSLAPATIQGIVSILTFFFEYLTKEEIIHNNPCSNIILPKRKVKKLEIFTKIEQRLIINELIKEGKPRSYLVLFALLTGLRLSELCALTWNQVDINNKIVHISASTRRIKEGNKTRVIVDTPKSDTSIRDVPLTKYLISILIKLKENNSNYVFCKNNGQRYDNRSIQKYFNLLLKKLEIKQSNFHTLRHTFATSAIESGMDIKTLSIILGHSNISTTMNLYVHPNAAYMRKSMEILSTQFIKK